MQDSAGDRYKSDSDLALKAEPCPDDSARWESFVSSVRSIPVLAQSVYRLSNLLMVPPVDLAAITRVACTDLGLAAQLLKLVNSGISDVPVHDLDYAVVQLGRRSTSSFHTECPSFAQRWPASCPGTLGARRPMRGGMRVAGAQSTIRTSESSLYRRSTARSRTLPTHRVAARDASR